ncbi:hypothetical protein [Streptomyces sp. NPDC001089]
MHAQRADDVSSCCNPLGQTSRVLADLGHYDKAMTLADQAIRLADTRAHPAVRYWLHAVRARHHAAQTHLTEVTDDLASARALLPAHGAYGASSQDHVSRPESQPPNTFRTSPATRK